MADELLLTIVLGYFGTKNGAFSMQALLKNSVQDLPANKYEGSWPIQGI